MNYFCFLFLLFHTFLGCRTIYYVLLVSLRRPSLKCYSSMMNFKKIGPTSSNPLLIKAARYSFDSRSSYSCQTKAIIVFGFIRRFLSFLGLCLLLEE